MLYQGLFSSNSRLEGDFEILEQHLKPVELVNTCSELNNFCGSGVEIYFSEAKELVRTPNSCLINYDSQKVSQPEADSLRCESFNDLTDVVSSI